MSRTVTAFFDTRTEAQSAYDQLLEAGIPAGDVNIHDAGTGPDAGASVTSSSAAGTGESKGFWSSLGDIFMPDEDRYTYEEGLRRGGSILTVRAADGDFDRVSDILEGAGAADLDRREAQWRSEGWSEYDASRPRTAATSLFDANEGTASTAADHLSSTARDVTGARTSYAMAGGVPARSASTLAAQGEAGADYIPVAEEQMRVGKREVDHGRVRIRSYVVETPVEESVSLRNETVRVERNAVNRAATDADHLFREQVIEAEAHGEEAVVSKEARVVEEVRLDKDVEVRDETIRDNVRRTEVEVVDERTGRTVADTTVGEDALAHRPREGGTDY